MTIVLSEYKVRIIRALRKQGHTRKELKRLLGVPFEKMSLLDETLKTMRKDACLDFHCMTDRYFLSKSARLRYTDAVLNDLVSRLIPPKG